MSVREALAWCRSTAPAPVLDRLRPGRRLCVACLREARAREGETSGRCLMEQVPGAACAGRAGPNRAADRRRWSSASASAFSSAGTRALAAAGASQGVPAEALAERAMSEAAAFAIRIDVAEELGRLQAHLDEIARLLRRERRAGQAARLPDPGTAPPRPTRWARSPPRSSSPASRSR